MASSPYDLSCWWDVKHKYNQQIATLSEYALLVAIETFKKNQPLFAITGPSHDDTNHKFERLFLANKYFDSYSKTCRERPLKNRQNKDLTCNGRC